ncbi:PP2C family protein-serine/threonine phosphatase [Chamaesiphon minutus]|uniref:Serine phosphatase RsbU, regulator of sigma subunit n=1 Tax=Chamaesiphon minutus (strain ATCC 27169 / PCC 6605) TaxID=1173020 RepID=K9UI81_CHAP6|nr:PP2C family protein-serine/threonine phosphatase [Chamaesiphon minutus]AFY94802.1 serine phosphatase RsbU, regulator of sigma subunit [Chamaesiphon minutus PCC 6605]
MNYEPQIMSVIALQEQVINLNRQQKKTHELLSNLGFALRSFKNLNQFLELIPLMVTRVTDSEGGAIILFKKTGQLQIQQLHCQGEGNCNELRKRIEMAIFQTLTDVSEGKEISFHTDFWEKLESRIELDIDYRIHIFRTPILLESGERGRLYVFTRNPSYEWTLDRQKLLQLVADQTAVAIHNDELTVELRKKERLDRELEIGAEIQERLLPKKFPDIPGLELAACYLNADRVGGDYYDFIPANYDRLTEKQTDTNATTKWSITIGDVMGKGVPAGLIMTMTRGMLRAEVLNGHSPSRILQHLNRVMYADLENSSRFVTLFYSEYDPATNILTYTNAAHNPPLYWQAATNRILRLDTQGMLIGLDADSQYEEAQVKLHQGDTIIYYTDGFTDAANQDGERFNEDNLIYTFHTACQQQLSSQGILDKIVSTLHTFTGNERNNGDDMTMVVLKVE